MVRVKTRYVLIQNSNSLNHPEVNKITISLINTNGGQVFAAINKYKFKLQLIGEKQQYILLRLMHREFEIFRNSVLPDLVDRFGKSIHISGSMAQMQKFLLKQNEPQ